MCKSEKMQESLCGRGAGKELLTSPRRKGASMHPTEELMGEPTLLGKAALYQHVPYVSP